MSLHKKAMTLITIITQTSMHTKNKNHPVKMSVYELKIKKNNR